MFFSKKSFLIGSVVLAMGAASGAVTAVESELFNALPSTGWALGSACTLVDKSWSDVSLPVADSGSTALGVEGRAVRSYSGTAQANTQVDLMVKVSKPDDPLEDLDSTVMEGAKVAVAIDTNGYLNAFCGSPAAWRVIGGEAETEGNWLRITFLIDKTAGRCQIMRDGSPVSSNHGYKSATDSVTGGSWYPLANAFTSIASLTVSGTTAIDDLVVNTGTMDEIVAAVDGTLPDTTGNPASYTSAITGGGTVKIPRTWYDQNSLARGAVDAPDASGMTVADKYYLGLDPNDGSMFKLTDMTTTGSKVTIQLPKIVKNANGVAVYFQTSTDKSTWANNGAALNGETSKELDLPSSGAVYYRLSTTSSPAN